MDGVATPVTGRELILLGFVEDTGPDQGRRVLRRECVEAKLM